MRFVFVLLLSLNVFVLSAQSTINFEQEEQEIKALFDTLFLNDGVRFYQPDSVKKDMSEEISERLTYVLSDKKSFSYPFSALNRMGIRESRDGKVRVFTWSIKLETGQHSYYGFIQKKRKKEVQLFRLNEEHFDNDSVKFISLTQDNWLGMNYYQIIDFKRNSKKYYLLIGMRNNGSVSKSKVIDVLYFTRNKAKFGKPVFKSDEKRIKRVLFEYSHNVSMVLGYDERYKMVVFDHLAPENSSLKGQYRFYGPDGSYDAFLYNGQKWVYRPEEWIVGERNKKSEQMKTKIFDKQIYQPK